MNVDRALIQAADRLLRASSPQRNGKACAAYLRGGDTVVAESRDDPEFDVITQSEARGELIAALVTLQRNGEGSSVVRPPAAEVTERLQFQARRHASIAVSGSSDGDVEVRPLWELVAEIHPDYPNSALQHGRYGGGMKDIAADLTQVAREIGVARAHSEFPSLLVDTLRRDVIRTNARAPAAAGMRFSTPAHLDSISLRHVWLGFEAASEEFTFTVIEAARSRLERLGCNDADIVHIRQGLEALRNIVSVLIVFTGTRLPPANECPFYPYESSRLAHGTPMHLYLQFPRRAPHLPATASSQNEALVRDLISVMAERGPGGFTSYLRQRELYKVDLFNGGGAGHCPFSSMSNELVYSTASGLERALEQQVILLNGQV